MYSLKRFHSLVIFLLLVSFLQSGCGAGKGPGAEQKAGRRPVALVLHTIIGGTILDGRLSYPRTIDGTIFG
ncbi:MAG: hypothetical protein NTV06_03645, partial [candidate division Zixibacteria bacterium]|nr:hypothetical protein [candidate division Zixibacteria bacterium]